MHGWKADDDPVQAIGWREWCWVHDVVPQFADDLSAIGDEDR